MEHHELPRASAERVRMEIDRADLWLTDHIKWLPTELQGGKKSREEVNAILRQESKDWAWAREGVRRARRGCAADGHAPGPSTPSTNK